MNHLKQNLIIIAGALLLGLTSATHAQFFSNKTDALLPEAQAFQVLANVEQSKLRVSWSIANDYYMYREQFGIASSTDGVTIGEISYPQGEVEDDPEFGQVEVYFFAVDLIADIDVAAGVETIDLVLKGQGCNKPVGVCYPPQTRTLSIAYDGPATASKTPSTLPADRPAEKSFWTFVLAALGAGVLLSFTPCVLPMIPILAGLIAGQQNPSKLRSGWLAICYVAGTVVTYAIAGWVAGKTGTQLQAHFQNPWVIGFICSLLILLAASLFGAFKIQLPSSLQSKLNGAGGGSRSASWSSFSLGLISALVVGACVSPILIVTLGAAIAQGDPILGAATMASMAIGMGSLLVAFGFGAGWLLPKTGAWMTQIQVLFGFMVLGVAIYIASSLAAIPSLYLWAALLLVAGFYLWQLAHGSQQGLLSSSLKAAAMASLLWGSMSLIGAATGGDDIMQPLRTLSLGNNAQGSQEKSSLPFQTTTTLAGAKQLLAEAKAAGQPVLVDFYADWCLDCKRMHRTTFTEASIARALQGWKLIEIDVTETSKDSEEVKKYFSVFGPPATLFIRSDGQEASSLRQYGYMSESVLLEFLNKVEV